MAHERNCDTLDATLNTFELSEHDMNVLREQADSIKDLQELNCDDLQSLGLKLGTAKRVLRMLHKPRELLNVFIFLFWSAVHVSSKDISALMKGVGVHGSRMCGSERAIVRITVFIDDKDLSPEIAEELSNNNVVTEDWPDTNHLMTSEQLFGYCKQHASSAYSQFDTLLVASSCEQLHHFARAAEEGSTTLWAQCSAGGIVTTLHDNDEEKQREGSGTLDLMPPCTSDDEAGVVHTVPCGHFCDVIADAANVGVANVVDKAASVFIDYQNIHVPIEFILDFLTAVANFAIKNGRCKSVRHMYVFMDTRKMPDVARIMRALSVDWQVVVVNVLASKEQAVDSVLMRYLRDTPSNDAAIQRRRAARER